jgi:hypothetical protein
VTCDSPKEVHNSPKWPRGGLLVLLLGFFRKLSMLLRFLAQKHRKYGAIKEQSYFKHCLLSFIALGALPGFVG